MIYADVGETLDIFQRGRWQASQVFPQSFILSYLSVNKDEISYEFINPLILKNRFLEIIMPWVFKTVDISSLISY